MPSTNKMRKDLYKVYDYRPNWVRKVTAMPWYQVAAVWKRFAAVDFDPARIKKDGAKSVTSKKRIAEAVDRMSVADLKHTTYLCSDCRGWFIADNPNLCECRFCGSERIQKGVYIYGN